MSGADGSPGPPPSAITQQDDNSSMAGGRRAIRLEVELPPNPLASAGAPIELVQRLSRPLVSPRTMSLEDKLAMAERRRQEFQSWLSSRKRHAERQQQQGTGEEARRMHRLAAQQERHEQAASAYAAQLEQRRSRASRSAQRRAAALMRIAEAREAATSSTAQRLQEQLDEAEQRRRLLQDMEKERLKQEHQLVLTRLNMRREDDPSREERSRRLEQRLSQAEHAREQLLGLRARRAGAKAARARTQGTLARALQAQEAEERRRQLEERLRQAQHRRAAALASSPRSPGPLSSSLVSPRTSASGAGQLTPPAPSPATPAGRGGWAATLAAGEAAAGAAATGRATAGQGLSPQPPSRSVQPQGLESAAEASPTPPMAVAQGRGLAEGQREGQGQGQEATLSPAKAAVVTVAANQQGGAAVAGPGAGLVLPPVSAPNAWTGGSLAVAAGAPLLGGFGAIAASGPGPQAGAAVGAGAGAAGVPRDPVREAAREAAEQHMRVEKLRRQISCRKLQQCWRNFVRKHRTTRALAAAFVSTGITSVPPPLPSPVTSPVPARGDPFGARAGASDPASSSSKATGSQNSLGVAADAGAAIKSAPITIIGALSPGASSPRGIDRFDEFAAAMRDPATLRSAQALLRRLERRLAGCGRPLPSCARLLLRLFPNSAVYQEQARAAARRGGASAPPVTGGGGAGAQAAGPGGGGDRYPARVFLTAWMVVKYPEVVFNAVGQREQRLADHAGQLVAVFEALLTQLVHVPLAPGARAGEGEGPGAGRGMSGADAEAAAAAAAALPPSPLLTGMRLIRMGLHPGTGAGSGAGAGAAGDGEGVAARLGSTATLLLKFDEVWLQYLDQFVAWKTEDAASLESELIRMAAQMERSLRRKLASPPGGAGGPGSGDGRQRALQDLAAMEEQVARDHGLLRERVARLSGLAGVARLEAAIEAARQQADADGGFGATSTEVSASEPESDRESRRAPRGAGAGWPRGAVGARSGSGGGTGSDGSPPGARPPGAIAAAAGGAGARQASNGGLALQTKSNGSASATSAPASVPTGAPVPFKPAVPAVAAPMPEVGAANPRDPSAPAPTSPTPTVLHPNAAVTAAPSSQPPAAPAPAANRPTAKPGGLARGFFKSAPSKTPAPQPSAQPSGPASGSALAASPRSPSTALSAVPASPGPKSPSTLVSAMVPGLSRDALANLTMVNDLLHQPSKQLPSTDLEASFQALWDQGKDQDQGFGALGSRGTGTGQPPPPSGTTGAAGAGQGLGGVPLLSPDEVEGLSAEEAVALLKARARAVAEAAFWDAAEQRVLKGLQNGNLLLAAAPLAAEVGRDLAEIVTDPTLSAQLASEFGTSNSNDQDLAERLEEAARQVAASAQSSGARASKGAAAAAAAAAAGGALPGSLPGLLLLLERLGSLMVEYGAPARREPSEQDQQRIRDELTAALTSLATLGTSNGSASDQGKEPGPAASAGTGSGAGTGAGAGSGVGAGTPAMRLARSLTRAIRLLHLQLKQLKLDAANAKLAALSQQLGGAAGLQYVRDRFRTLYRLDGETAAGGAQGPGAAAAAAGSGPGDGGSASGGNDSAAPPPSVPTTAAFALAPAPSVERLVSSLPKTWTWLLQAAQAGPSMQTYCRGALGLDLDAAVAAAAAAAAASGGGGASLQPGAGQLGGAPAVIRTGRAIAPGSAAGRAPPTPSGPRPEFAPRIPVPLLSPEGLSRAGLVTLISGGTPAAGSGIPEALALDAERLHAAQNQFQSLVVLAASFLLVQQFKSQYPSPPPQPSPASPSSATQQPSTAPTPATPAAPATPQPWDRPAAKARLQVLLADPSLQLQHLVAELSQMAGLSSGALPPDQQSKAEAQLKQALLRIVDPAGAAFRSLSNGLAAALLTGLLCGAGGDAVSGVVSRLLARIGAGLLLPDVLGLASQLLSIAGVQEAVHLSAVYSPLAHRALAQVGAAGRGGAPPGPPPGAAGGQPAVAPVAAGAPGAS